MTSLKGLIIMMLSSEIEIARKRLYANWIKFESFKNIDEAELKRIKELVKKANENLFADLPERAHLSDVMTKYLAVMRYLGSTNVNNELPTFDAKIVFLIEAVDPNMEMYKTFLEHPVVLKSQIASEEKMARKMALTQRFNNQKGNIESNIRLNVGFYDAKLLNYEESYFKAIRCHEELMPVINHVYFHKLTPIFGESNGFENISKEDNDKLILKAEDYISKYGSNITTLSFHLFYQSELLGLNSIDEKIIFFILVMDKNLKILDIFNDESIWDEIKRRMLDEVGYYNKDLVLLEKAYQEKFVPDYTSWDMKKEVKF